MHVCRSISASISERFMTKHYNIENDSENRNSLNSNHRPRRLGYFFFPILVILLLHIYEYTTACASTVSHQSIRVHCASEWEAEKFLSRVNRGQTNCCHCNNHLYIRIRALQLHCAHVYTYMWNFLVSHPETHWILLSTWIYFPCSGMATFIYFHRFSRPMENVAAIFHT